MLTSTEARKRLGVGRSKLEELIRTGEIEAIKTGDKPNSHYRIPEAAIEAFIQRRRVIPVQATS